MWDAYIERVWINKACEIGRTVIGWICARSFWEKRGGGKKVKKEKFTKNKKKGKNLPKELSGSERSDNDGTFRMLVNLPGRAGTSPSSSASEACSCFINFAITINMPPPPPPPSVMLPPPKKLPTPRTSRWKACFLVL